MNDAGREIAHYAALDPARQDDLELVSAKTANLAGLGGCAFKSLGNLFEQRVTSRMAERVVDLLESVKIEQQHRAGPVLLVLRCQYLLERLRHLEAIGEARKRIVVGKPRRRFLTALLLGQVGAGAAEPDEVSEFVVYRTAAHRPPALFALDRGAHRQFLKCGSRGEMEHQGSLTLVPRVGEIEKLDQWAADQGLGRVAESIGNGCRYVGHQAASIGLPEPALAGFLVVSEDISRAGLDAGARPAPFFF